MDGSCCVCVFLSCGHLWGDLCTGFLSSGLGGLPVLGPRAGEGVGAHCLAGALLAVWLLGESVMALLVSSGHLRGSRPSGRGRSPSCLALSLLSLVLVWGSCACLAVWGILCWASWWAESG